MTSPHTPTTPADIATAILSERDRALGIVSHFMGSLWSEDQRHVASLIFNEIHSGPAHTPTTPLPEPVE